MRTPVHRYPSYGTVGLLLMLVMQVAVFSSHLPSPAAPGLYWITSWTTPVCWWGYILAIAAWLYRRQGGSCLSGKHQRLWLMSLSSIIFWCLFEAYNCLLPGWHYVNLNPHLAIRYVGYALSFATILPGIFLTAEFLQSYGLFINSRGRLLRWTPMALRVSTLLGAVCCLVPPFLPAEIRGYFWGAIWIGFILWLEPINYRRGVQSLYRDWESGDYSRTWQLMVSGLICGLLWEFWNYGAYTKWVYDFPVPSALAGIRYFEMPLIGFPGFAAFAIECFVLFHFAASFFTTEDKLGL